MIEGGWFPGGCAMTDRTVCSVRAFMFVVILMTGIAVAGCAFEDIVGMAACARYRGMCSA
jgi:hypothetical protein